MYLESRGSYVSSVVHDGFWEVAFKTRVNYILIEWVIALLVLWFLIRRRRKKK